MQDSRFYAISSIGWGKGTSTTEALENYVATQLRNFPSNDYVTDKQLREGELKPDLWYAPEGVEGFLVDHTGLVWQLADNHYEHARPEERVELGTERP